MLDQNTECSISFVTYESGILTSKLITDKILLDTPMFFTRMDSTILVFVHTLKLQMSKLSGLTLSEMHMVLIYPFVLPLDRIRAYTTRTTGKMNSPFVKICRLLTYHCITKALLNSSVRITTLTKWMVVKDFLFENLSLMTATTIFLTLVSSIDFSPTLFAIYKEWNTRLSPACIYTPRMKVDSWLKIMTMSNGFSPIQISQVWLILIPTCKF